MAEDKKVKLNFSFKIGMAAVIFAVLVVAFVGFKLGGMFYKNKQPEITEAYISEKIKTVSELTTAELTYNGLIIYSEGDIPLITKKGFSMRYTANVRAGIDFSKIKATVIEDKIIINIPEAEVQSVDVDSDSIEFYDERYALFNWTQKEDVIDAISIAKEDTSSHADITKLIKKANKQTEIMIRSTLANYIGDKELIVKPLS